MRIEERLGLAHLAYHRAVVRARREATPASWRQLLTAGRNLRGAKRDRERLRPSTGPPRTAARGAGDGVVVRLPRIVESPCPDLARELERARALMARARALRASSRRLLAELAAVREAWQRFAARRR